MADEIVGKHCWTSPRFVELEFGTCFHWINGQKVEICCVTADRDGADFLWPDKEYLGISQGFAGVGQKSRRSVLR